MKKRILVTGATGFIGRHAVRALTRRGETVTVVGRSTDRLLFFKDNPRVSRVVLDLDDLPKDLHKTLGRPTHCLHLAWPGLPNYLADRHMEHALPQSKRFLDALLREGLQRLVVAGTCFEYGMIEGELREDMIITPTTLYGQAKNQLRLHLEDRVRGTGCTLSWARLFYLHGEGQSPNSLFAQLDRAIDENKSDFDMSGGKQIRDYLPVDTAAGILAVLLLDNPHPSTVNVCSGRQTELRTLVKEHLRRRSSSIRLNLGVFPYPEWEPFRFWGSTDRLNELLSQSPKAQL
ncbi:MULTISPECIES: NAD(P)-dependent oxidoreductase [unclassified Pseudodesulfovibrio]|uniref:NAD-dependent epimerase/dehydratase family protein n=1 Tax=unclassified Pseudodesulfovibrio TaxID=2661612 RepID=UPI0013E37B15|nr:MULTISPECIES: NAD(P)-dependent oxidoreductase [unclassified Pseudodesulfovibrio]MCJ2163213.1 NAD(P)-dependent oxidoreductase [Pseudodesulfovibrio sp. S3-i]